jgi:hypothetical protein
MKFLVWIDDFQLQDVIVEIIDGMTQSHAINIRVIPNA